MIVRTRRIYDPPQSDEGTRFLVDAMWPRGVSKERADLTGWLRAIAPSKELRQRYHRQTSADAESWHAFVCDYQRELNAPTPAMALEIARLREALACSRVTLLFAARDTQRNNAIALRQWIEGGFPET